MREEKMDPNSVWHQALDRWLESVQQGRFPRWVIWTLLAATAVFLIVFAHSLVLRREVRRKTQQLSEQNVALEKEVAVRRKAEATLQQGRERLQRQNRALADLSRIRIEGDTDIVPAAR